MKWNLNNASLHMSAGLPKQFPTDRLPQVAFSGRSNVGKSSLINSLLHRKSLARVSGACAEHNVNVLEVTQNILQGLFSMIMVVDVTNADMEIDHLAGEFAKLGEELGMDIRFTRTELYEAMHHI